MPLDNLNINKLPSAHVWDSKAFVNINPFETCTLGLSVRRLELLVEGLSTRGVINGMKEVPGWDARILNEEMLEMVRREYPETAERIETKPYYRWQEEHKKALSVLGQMSMELANGLMFYECMIAEKPYLERIERQRAYRATKEAGGETAKGSGETGGAATGEGEGGREILPNAGQLSRPYIDSNGTTLLLKEIMESVDPVPGVVLQSGLRWDVSGTFRGSTGAWELVVDMNTNTVVHFNFVAQ